MMKTTLTALLTCLYLVSVPAIAETPEEKGLNIALETDRRDSGFGDYTVDGEMTLMSAGGERATRVLEMKTLEVTDDGDKRLVTFSRPQDVKGTVSLTYSHGLEPDDQWILPPALGRTKRLAARDKTGSFVGSEFAFEDIGSWEVKKYRYRWLRDEVVDGIDCYVVENIPAYEFSGYARQEEWVRKDIYHPLKIVYYDTNNRLLKTLHFNDYIQYNGKYWRPSEMVMENYQSGNKSIIQWSNYHFGTGLDENSFLPTGLARASR